MRKIFASKKAKRKPGDFKAPVPMVGGIHNAKLSAAELDTILTGRQEPNGVRKPVSSISTDTRHSHQHPIPARPISSPPVLAMPKPRRPVRQVESLLRSQDFDKTQIESSSESEEIMHLDEDEQHESPVDIDARVLVLWPENWTDKEGLTHPTTGVQLISNEVQRQQLLAAPDGPHERFEEISLLQDHPPAPVEQSGDPVSPSNHQRSGVVSVTSSSEDSNLQYDSARQSPLISVSSEQTPDNASMDLLKKQLSQASSDHQKPTKMLSNALLIEDDEPEPLSTSMQLHQASSDTSTPKLPKEVVQKLVAPNATAESSSTSSNTVSPLLHAKITSTAVHPLPLSELPSVAAPATVNVTPAYQNNQLPKQCDDNERSPAVVASRPEVPSSLSQGQRPDQSSFSTSLEALKRQVDLMQKQREIEHLQWEQREMEHREREKIMFDKIRETQIQLEQALTQQLLSMTTSDGMNGGASSTTSRTRQSSRPSSKKGKETRDENGEPFHFTDQEDSPAWDTKRGQQLRSTTRLRSRSSETPRSSAYRGRSKDRETWKSIGAIRQQQQQQQPPQTVKESHSYTTFVDPIRGSKGQLYVSRRSQNEDAFFDNGHRSQNTIIANQRHEQLQAHDDTDTTSPDDEHITILGRRRSQTGSASSVPLYGKNSVENSPHGSNISAKSDVPVSRRNRKAVGRSSSQERRRRSRSYSAPESPQDYHSALEDEEYEDAFHDYQDTTRTSRGNQQRLSPNTDYYHTGRRDRWSKPPSSSAARRHSPSMYEQPRSERLAAHLGFLPHQPTSHRNRRRRDSQRMMDDAFLDEELRRAAYLAGMPPPMARLPRGMHPPPPPPPPGMPYHDDWPAGLTPGGWPPSIYRVAPPSSFSSSGTDSYQEATNMMEGGQPGLFRRYSNRGANGNGGGGPPSQQQTFPGGGLRQPRMHPAMYQHPATMDGPSSMSFR
ncbi:hypothetical protein BJV82DRAFT_665118 [Fennellomyces sp. T-0311]|nr:hypothetical protein BJV82DRAFT_665118 [Fennellomyces sp. T-0311]